MSQIGVFQTKRRFCSERSWWAIVLGMVLLCLTGCATVPESKESRQKRAAQLAEELRKLTPMVTPRETSLLARGAVEKSAELRRRYNIRLNHNLHNLAVYWGLQKRGFCWHWQDDLAAGLENVPLSKLEVRRICSNRGSIWHEHHALVVLPKGAAEMDGVVLDPWRQEGALWFGSLKTDQYSWVAE